MKLLAIEASTEACSVALAVDGALHERFEIAPRRHAELLLPWIHGLLAEAGIAKSQLDAIAVGRGPGAFTGVRLGIAIAQGIAHALDRPIVPVSTLAALALGAAAPVDARVLATIDARMGEVYVGRFRIGEDGLPFAIADEQLCRPAEVAVDADAAEPWYAVGSGLGCDGGIMQSRLADRLLGIAVEALPRAAAVARIAAADFAAGRAIAAAAVEPAYLRDKVAQTLAERGVSS